MNKALLNQAFEFSFQKLEESGGDPVALSVPVRTVAMICTAQGIIDNGGLEHFYESDFAGNPPYSIFADAYRAIGAQEAANCIEQTALMFEIAEPHLDRAQRLKFLEQVEQDTDHDFARLGQFMVGNKEIWDKLSDYVENHSAAFKTA